MDAIDLFEIRLRIFEVAREFSQSNDIRKVLDIAEQINTFVGTNVDETHIVEFDIGIGDEEPETFESSPVMN